MSGTKALNPIRRNNSRAFIRSLAGLEPREGADHRGAGAAALDTLAVEAFHQQYVGPQTKRPPPLGRLRAGSEPVVEHRAPEVVPGGRVQLGAIDLGGTCERVTQRRCGRDWPACAASPSSRASGVDRGVRRPKRSNRSLLAFLAVVARLTGPRQRPPRRCGVRSS